MKHNNSWKRYLCLVFCLFLMCMTYGCGPEKKEKSHTETSEIVTEINNDEDEEIEKSINNDNEEESLQTDFSNALEFHLLDVEQGTSILEYSCAMKSHFRKSGNQMSGKWKSSYASLLA